MWPENRAYFGGFCTLRPSIAGEQPKLCRSAAGNPSSRSLRNNGRHSDGNATAPPDSAPFRSYFRATMRCECMYVCAAVQVAPTLRVPPRKPCDLMGASFTPRTRRFHAASTWRGSRNGTSLPRAQKFPSNLAHSDGKPRVQLSSHVTRPLPADLGEPASMQAAFSLCHAYGMRASRRQQQACVWNAATDGTSARCHRNRAI